MAPVCQGCRHLSVPLNTGTLGHTTSPKPGAPSDPVPMPIGTLVPLMSSPTHMHPSTSLSSHSHGHPGTPHLSQYPWAAWLLTMPRGTPVPPSLNTHGQLDTPNLPSCPQASQYPQSLPMLLGNWLPYVPTPKGTLVPHICPCQSASQCHQGLPVVISTPMPSVSPHSCGHCSTPPYLPAPIGTLLLPFSHP